MQPRASSHVSTPPSLDSRGVRALLDRLHRAAAGDRWRILRALPRAGAAWLGSGREAAFDALLRDAFIPVSREQGRFLYLLARAIDARRIVEFGTSFGISTLYLAAAACDNGGGRVIGTELEPAKHARAVGHLREAGLDAWAEVRLGDALQTLARDVPDPIDLLLLDGWKHLYQPILDLLAPKIRPGGLVLADNVFTFKRTLAPFVAGLQSGASGFVSVTVPFPSGFECALRLG